MANIRSNKSSATSARCQGQKKEQGCLMSTRPRLDADCRGWSHSSARYNLASAACTLRVVCKFILGFVYLIYSASKISNRLKSFSCLIVLVFLTICSLFNVVLWKSWPCMFERRSRLDMYCNSARKSCSRVSYICLGLTIPNIAFIFI